MLEAFGFIPAGDRDQSDFDVVCIVAILDRRGISETVGLLPFSWIRVFPQSVRAPGNACRGDTGSGAFGFGCRFSCD